MINKDIENKIEKDKNNVAIIKFILALLIIFFHAFPLTLSKGYNDPIFVFTNGQINLGTFCVSLFLFFSGFFITKGVFNSSNMFEFFKKRIKKIIPSLFIVLVITVFIIGPLFCDISIKAYFTNSSPFLYLIKNTFLITTHKIKGLFENNPYPYSVNGSLWTLPLEFICYIVCYTCYKIKILNKKIFKYTFIPFIICIIFKNKICEIIPFMDVIFPLISFFYLGMLFYIYKDKIKLNILIFIFSIIIFIVSIIFNFYNYSVFFILPYIAIYLSFNWHSDVLNYKIFKISYEIYLIGFLIQQIIEKMSLSGANPYINFVISSILSIAFGYLLNMFVNKIFERSRNEKNNIHTFVILAYKESEYLEECIKSVLNQTIATNVIIATSTPNEYINKLAKKYKLIVKSRKISKGIGDDFDYAKNISDSELVTIAHQDDIYDSNYVEEIINIFQKQPKSIIIFPKYYEIKNDKKEFSNLNLKIKRILLLPLKIRFLSGRKFIKRLILRFGNPIGCPSVTFVREKCPNKLFLCDMKCDVDWYAWEQLSKKKGRFTYINKYLMGHRIHEDSTTTKIINDNIRNQEDLYMFKKFWPNCIAKLLNNFYKKSENNNNSKK